MNNTDKKTSTTECGRYGEDIAVKVGQAVVGGETIGVVANTATYEALEGAHLHFELTKDGEYVNPSVILDL